MSNVIGLQSINIKNDPLTIHRYFQDFSRIPRHYLSTPNVTFQRQFIKGLAAGSYR